MSFNANLIGTPHYVFRAMNALIEKGQTFTLQGDDWDTMDWDAGNSQVMPTEAEIATKAEELRALDSYSKPRRGEYPLIGDQLDDLYRAGAFSSEMNALIAAVKTKYPKP